MREIKFIAWDKKDKRMTEPFALLDVPFWTNDVLEIKKGVVKSRAEVLQFTGLKDKKGKEIYEGDIVKILNPIHQGYSALYALPDTT